MPGANKRITKRLVEALKPGSIVWDTDVKGFGVRCQRRDKVYVLKTRTGGRQRWFSIGPHGSPWTPEKARTRAKRILGEIADRKDPATLRDESKRNPTVADLAAMFLREHVEAKRKPSTAKGYRDFLERLALPEIGQFKIADLTRLDVARLHHSLGRTPYQANRLLAVLSKMFAWAEKHGFREDGTNPCRHIERYPEQKRERFLSELELARLGDALSEIERTGTENPFVIAAIRLLIFTGARLGEILNLEWEHVDFERTMLLLPDSKTGQKTIYLSAPALDVLANLPRVEGNPFVICGDKPGAHLVNLEKPWQRIRDRATVTLWKRDGGVGDIIEDLEAKLERFPKAKEVEDGGAKNVQSLPPGMTDVRIHDLRHSFASMGASGGLSLPMIGKLLGHTQAATTERYAHLAADPVRAANEAIGERIAAVMKGDTDDTEVITFPK